MEVQLLGLISVAPAAFLLPLDVEDPPGFLDGLGDPEEIPRKPAVKAVEGEAKADESRKDGSRQSDF